MRYFVVATNICGRDVGTITVKPGTDTLEADGSEFDKRQWQELARALPEGRLPDLSGIRGNEGSSGWRD